MTIDGMSILSHATFHTGPLYRSKEEGPVGTVSSVLNWQLLTSGFRSVQWRGQQGIYLTAISGIPHFIAL